MTSKVRASSRSAPAWYSRRSAGFSAPSCWYGGPLLAEVAVRFSSFEYFWLVCLG